MDPDTPPMPQDFDEDETRLMTSSPSLGELDFEWNGLGGTSDMVAWLGSLDQNHQFESLPSSSSVSIAAPAPAAAAAAATPLAAGGGGGGMDVTGMNFQGIAAGFVHLEARLDSATFSATSITLSTTTTTTTTTSPAASTTTTTTTTTTAMLAAATTETTGTDFEHISGSLSSSSSSFVSLSSPRNHSEEYFTPLGDFTHIEVEVESLVVSSNSITPPPEVRFP